MYIISCIGRFRNQSPKKDEATKAFALKRRNKFCVFSIGRNATKNVPRQLCKIRNFNAVTVITCCQNTTEIPAEFLYFSQSFIKSKKSTISEINKFTESSFSFQCCTVISNSIQVAGRELPYKGMIHRRF